MEVGAIVFVQGSKRGFKWWPGKIDHIANDTDVRVLYFGENSFDEVTMSELKVYSEDFFQQLSIKANAKLRAALQQAKEEVGGSLPAATAAKKRQAKGEAGGSAAIKKKQPKKQTKKQPKKRAASDDEDDDEFEADEEDYDHDDDDDDDDDWNGRGKRKPPQKKTKKEKPSAKTKSAAKGKRKNKKPEVTEDAGVQETPKEARKGDVGEVGHRVVIKGEKDGRWRRGTVVQLDRAGVTQKYKVLGVKVLYDSNRTQLHPIPSPDVLSLGEKKEIRYWSSGTPCMRLGASVDQFARDTKKKAADRVALRLSQTKKPSVAKFGGDAVQIASLGKAEDRDARDKPSRWRRQWLVLREDGLLLCYGKAKHTQPAQVMGTPPT
jgi:hypothetical protein